MFLAMGWRSALVTRRWTASERSWNESNTLAIAVLVKALHRIKTERLVFDEFCLYDLNQRRLKALDDYGAGALRTIASTRRATEGTFRTSMMSRTKRAIARC